MCKVRLQQPFISMYCISLHKQDEEQAVTVITAAQGHMPVKTQSPCALHDQNPVSVFPIAC